MCLADFQGGNLAAPWSSGSQTWDTMEASGELKTILMLRKLAAKITLESLGHMQASVTFITPLVIPTCSHM